MNSSENQNNAGWKSGLARALANPVFICLLLAAVTLVVYWPVKNCDFVDYDDAAYFSSNHHVLGGLTRANIAWAFTTNDTAYWHPLTWLSLMLDAELYGKTPAGPHLTNLLFHTTNTILLFLLFRCLTGAVWRSAFVAALFALHPLHVESVAWIAERKDVLSTFFGLLALWAYARFVQKSEVENQVSSLRPPASGYYWLALLFFALGLMSKPMLVTLPFVLLLLDYWPLQRFTTYESQFKFSIWPFLLWEKIPFFILAVVSSAVTYSCQKNLGAVTTLERSPLLVRLAKVPINYVTYLQKTIWPESLAMPYAYETTVSFTIAVVWAMLLAGVTLLTLWRISSRPYLAVGWFWYLGTLVPVIGLVQVGGTPLADRFTYLPLIGLFVALAWGMGEMCVERRTPKLLIIFLAAIILAVCALRTRDQLGYWQNNETLLRHTLAVTKNNYIACINLGTWLSKKGQPVEAIGYFHQALQINPDDPDVLYNLGNACAKVGNWDEAIANYRHALRINPHQADVLDNLGLALVVKKQYAEAVTNFVAALKLNPDSASTHNNLATILFMEHRFKEAAQHYREALRITPDDPQLRVNFGDALLKLGQTNDAVKCYQAALRLDPGNAKIQAKMQTLGRIDFAPAGIGIYGLRKQTR